MSKKKKKKKDFKKIHIVLLILLCVVVFEIAFIAKNSWQTTRSDAFVNEFESATFAEAREEWDTWFDEYGAEEAYAMFLDAYKDEGFGYQHSAAHVFGELLYRKVGIPGVVVCDNSFAFGCYHSFFGVAISVEGLDIIQELDRECIKKFGELGLGCPHGIGHGILSFLGEENIQQALDECKKLNWQDPIGGCTSGVFMEYNFKTMEDAEGLSIREFDEDNPHFPCNSITEEFHEACYWDLPQWWEQVLDHDYPKISSYCEDLPKGSVYDACYRGLGNAIGPSTAYDVDESVARCGEMITEEGRMLCLSGASWSFHAEPKTQNLAPELCAALGDKASQVHCIDKSDLYGDIQSN